METAGAGGVTEHVVCDSHQGVFLDKHLAVFHHYSQTVYIGVYDKADICHTGLHKVGNPGEVFGNRLGIVCKVACGVAVEFDDFIDAEAAKQLRYNHTAHAVDSVYCYGEICFWIASVSTRSSARTF